MVQEAAAGDFTHDRAPRPSHDADLGQIAERLRWTPAQRFRYFLDMVEFWEQARAARRVAPDD